MKNLLSIFSWIVLIYTATVHSQTEPTTFISEPVTKAFVDDFYISPLEATARIGNNEFISFSPAAPLPSFLTLSSEPQVEAEFFASIAQQKDNKGVGSIVINPDTGNVYVTEKEGGDISDYLPNGTRRAYWKMWPDNQYDKNINMSAVLVGDYLYLSRDTWNTHRIKVGSNNGTSSERIMNVDPFMAVTSIGGMIYRDDVIYAVNTSLGSAQLHKIKHNDKSSQITSNSSGIQNPGKFNPSIAFDYNGRLIIACNYDHYRGSQIRWMNITGANTTNEIPELNNLPWITDILVDKKGNLYISFKDAPIRKYKPDFSSYTEIVPSFTNVTAMAMDKKGVLYFGTEDSKVYRLITTGSLTGRPTIDDIGIHPISINATDGITTAQQNFDLYVYGPSKITGFNDIRKYRNDYPFELTASSTDSEGVMTYSITTSRNEEATISGNVVTPKYPGKIPIRVTQRASGFYLGDSKGAYLTIVDSMLAKLSDFPDITKTALDPDFEIKKPKSESHAPITYTIADPKVATINGKVITIHGKGKTTITAHQMAMNKYLADSITATLTVEEITPKVTITSTPIKNAEVDVPYGAPVIAVNNSDNPLTVAAVGELPPFLKLSSPNDIPTLIAPFQQKKLGPFVYDYNSGNYYGIELTGPNIYKVSPNGEVSTLNTRTTTSERKSALVIDNYLYVSVDSSTEKGIQRYNLLEQNPSPETVYNGSAIRYMTYREGHIYATNTNGPNEIIKLNIDNFSASVLVKAPNYQINFYGLDFDTAGDLYIVAANSLNASRRIRTVYKFSTSAGMDSDLSPTNVDFNYYDLPSDLKIDANNNVYVSSSGSPVVKKYSPDFSSFIEYPYFTNRVMSLALSPNGVLSFANSVYSGAYSLPTLPVLEGTPTSADIGVYPVTIKASDKYASDQQDYTITVAGPATLGRFDDITKYINEEDFDLIAPTSDSPGAFSYSSSNENVATISGKTVTLMGVGSTQITAIQAADGVYLSGSKSMTLTVNRAAPILGAFDDISKTIEDEDFKIKAPISKSTGAFTYTISNDSIATIVGDNISIRAIGTATITASQAADANFDAPEPITAILTVGPPVPFVRFTSTPITTVTVGETYNTSLAAVSNGSEPIRISVKGTLPSFLMISDSTHTNGSQAFISGTPTIQDIGEHYIALSATDGTATGEQDYVLTVYGSSSIANFEDINKIYNEAAFDLTPTSNSEGLFSYSSSNPDVATVIGKKVILTGVGATKITATQVSHGYYLETSKEVTLTVSKASISVTGGSATQPYNGEALTSAETNVTSGALAENHSLSATLSGSQVVVGKSANIPSGAKIKDRDDIDVTHNYNITYAYGTLEVTPAALTVSAQNKVKVYGTEDPELTYEITSGALVGEDGFMGQITRVAGEDVGTYKIESGTLALSDNYELTFNSADFTINKATPVITAHDVQTFNYDGTIKHVVGSLNHSETELSYAPQQGYSNAGTYGVTILAQETSNYLSATKEVSLVIKNAEISGVTFGGDANSNTFTYDGNAHSIYAANLPEGATVTYANNGQTEAGSYSVTATVSKANYKDLVLTAEMVIKKAKAIITADAVQTITYDGAVKNVIASLNHTETELAYAPQQGYTNAGTYTVTISAEETDNYLSASKEVSLVIEKAIITGVVFEGSANSNIVTYDGKEHSIYVTGLPEGAKVVYANNNQVGAGTYTVTATVSKDNYNDAILTADLIIKKAEAIITADAVQTYTYDGEVKNVLASLNHTETELGFTPQQGYTNAGTYTVTISAKETDNYLPASKAVSLVIEKGGITGVAFEGGANSKIVTYDGTEHSIYVTGLPEGATVVYDNNGQVDAGIYTVTAIVSKENYDDITLTADLIIKKAEAIITANAQQTWTFDGAVKNVSASLNHSETELAYAPQQGYANAGTYTVTIASDETDNYLSASKEVTLVIEKGEITGMAFEDGANSKIVTYDGTEHSVFVTGIPEGATVVYDNNGQVDAGTYTVTATVSKENYNDVILTIVMEIEKASQNIVFEVPSDRTLRGHDSFRLEAAATSGLSVTYSYSYASENPAATVSADGLVTLLEPGQITITATQQGNHNYKAAEPVTQKLNVLGDQATIKSIVINGKVYENLSQDIYYLIDCGSDENEVSVQLEPIKGSTIDTKTTFTIATPKPGIYNKSVTVTSEDGVDSATYHITIEKTFNFEDIVIQKFNNVLLVNNNPKTNGGYKFVKYDWYKNDIHVGSEQYYSQGPNATDQIDENDDFYVLMTMENGQTLKSCSTKIQMKSSNTVFLTPNPVSAGAEMQFHADFSKEELETMELSITTLQGGLLQHIRSNQSKTAIRLSDRLPVGVYVLICKTKWRTKSLKFIVK
jgi:hypothetical protein